VAYDVREGKERSENEIEEKRTMLFVGMRR
jgi:hypothetical protein